MLKLLFISLMVTAGSAQAFEVSLSDYACGGLSAGNQVSPVLYLKKGTSDQAVITNEIAPSEQMSTPIITSSPETSIYYLDKFSFSVTDVVDPNDHREFRVTYYNIDDLMGTYYYRALVKSGVEIPWRIQNLDVGTGQKSIDPKHEYDRIIFAKQNGTSLVFEVKCGHPSITRQFIAPTK